MAISLQERTSRRSKAVAIAAVLVVAGCDHTTAHNLDDTGWQRAAAAAGHNTGHAWTDASPATRTIVVTLLETHNMTDTRPAPGTAMQLNDRCPWPERRGLLAVVVRTDGCGHVYPVHGLGRNEVVVHVSLDPLEREGGPAILPNGLPWSCVVTLDCLDPITDDTVWPPGTTEVDPDDDRDDYVRGVENAGHDLTAGRPHEAHNDPAQWAEKSTDYRRGYNTRYTEGPAVVDHGEFDAWVNRH